MTDSKRVARKLSASAIVLLTAAQGCGGSTDIDFTGPTAADAGTTGGTGGGSAGSVSGGSAGVGNSGGVGPGGTAGIGPGGTGAVGGGSCGPCATPPPSPVGTVTSCCVGDKCGISIDLLGDQCIEQGQPGKPDPTCPTQNIQGFPLQGCCKPNNMCGVQDPLFGLGCVDPSEFGGPAGPPCGGGGTGGGTGGVGGGGTGGVGTGGVGTGGVGGSKPFEKTCGTSNPDVCTASEKCCVLDPGLDHCAPTNQQCACTSPNCETINVECDGPEDCPGQICCAVFSFQQNQYTNLRCQNTCSGSSQREVCHPGQKCLNPNHTCGQSPSLPSNLNRCN
jgi:hypothetical protein